MRERTSYILQHNLHILKSSQLNLAILRSKIRIFHKGEISVIWAKMARMREVASTTMLLKNIAKLWVFVSIFVHTKKGLTLAIECINMLALTYFV